MTRSDSQVRHPIIAEDLASIVSASLPWQKLYGKKIVVTGASGCMPAYLIETLLFLNENLASANKITVVGTTRNRAHTQVRFKHYDERKDLIIVEHDIKLPFDSLSSEKQSQLSGASFLVHAASSSSRSQFAVDPHGTIAANTEGTKNVLELADSGIKPTVLYFSSSEVYGQLQEKDLPAHEELWDPRIGAASPSNYPESKKYGEALCLKAHDEGQVVSKVVRPFHTFGPGLNIDDGRVFSDFVGSLIARKPLVVKSSGHTIRSFCYLADATVAFFAVLLSGEGGAAYNVGNDQEVLEIGELARKLALHFGVECVEGVQGIEMNQDTLVRNGITEATPVHNSNISKIYPDCSRIGELGWAPTTSVIDAFERTVKSCINS